MKRRISFLGSTASKSSNWLIIASATKSSIWFPRNTMRWRNMRPITSASAERMPGGAACDAMAGIHNEEELEWAWLSKEAEARIRVDLGAVRAGKRPRGKGEDSEVPCWRVSFEVATAMDTAMAAMVAARIGLNWIVGTTHSPEWIAFVWIVGFRAFALLGAPLHSHSKLLNCSLQLELSPTCGNNTFF